jgi:D-threo-aldose 1-dehydrogenase
MSAAIARDVVRGVRRLGFGVSGALGSPLFSEHRCEHLVRTAYEFGVRVFDTAPSYGAGLAETRLGHALKYLPRFDCIVSTKAGVTSSGLHSRKRDFSVDAIRRSVDLSLQRLGLHRIDWLFLHGPAPQELTDPLLAYLAEERDEGRIQKVGIAGRGAEIDTAIATKQFQLVMAPVHARLSDDERARVARVRAAGLELIGIEAMRPATPRHPAPTSLSSARRLASALLHPAPAPSGPAMTASDALAWSLTEGGAHRVVCTTTRLSRLEANARTADLCPAPG